MAPLANSGIVGILFPQALPMHIHIDIVVFDHDTLDPEFKRDVPERLKIAFSLALQPFKRLHRHHQCRHRGKILLHVGLTQGFHRFVNTEVALMILGILNRFSAAGRAGDQHDHKQDSDPARPTYASRQHHVRSIGIGRKAGQAVRRGAL